MPEQKKAIRRKNQSSDEDQLVASKKQPIQAPTDVMRFQPNQQVTPQNALQLQRTIGNAAVQRLMIQRETTYPTNAEQTPCEIGDIQAYQSFPNTKKALYTFAETEHSAENFDCLDAILNYEKNPQPFLARQIYNLFIGKEYVEESESYNPNTGKMQTQRSKKITAPYPVNINFKNRAEIEKKIDKLDIGEIPPDLFSGVKRDVHINIIDTFSRLKFDPDWKVAYSKFVKSKKASVGTQIKDFFSGLFGSKKKKP